jgi:hypothetical protein
MEMRKVYLLRLAVVVASAVAILVVTTLPASAYGRFEFGVGLPISTDFTFAYVSLGLEAYARLLLGALAWETALKTYTTFDSLYIRNTLATLGSFFFAIGHVTNLMPYFGSTYFTFGAGWSLGRAFVMRIAANLAISIGGGFYPFLEFRFQFGLDP